MGKMTSVLKPVADRYNLKNSEERYQFRRLVRNFIKWYGYITQVVRMFDKDMHKEYLFLRYLLHLLPAEPADPCDLEGKLQLEYYKLQKTFEGNIQLEQLDGEYIPAKQKAVGGKQKKTPRFHRAVRSFYDKHGYPVSKHITTRTRADVVYFVMKPLEWLFILFLYTFDTHPEKRIAVQYSDYCKK